MQPLEDFKGRPIVGCPNYPTQGMNDLIKKILTPIVSCLRKYIKHDWNYVRKLLSDVDFSVY